MMSKKLIPYILFETITQEIVKNLPILDPRWLIICLRFICLTKYLYRLDNQVIGIPWMQSQWKMGAINIR